MQRCENCGSELPNNAQFCGNCGHVVSAATEVPTRTSGFPGADVPPFDAPTAWSGSHSPVPSGGEQDAPTAWSGPHSPVPMSGGQEPPTVQSGPHYPVPVSGERPNVNRFVPSEDVENWPTAPLSEEEEEEERRRRALLLGLGILADGQAPGGSVPMVQGTPQIGGVPMVQGTPQVGGAPMVQGSPSAQGFSPNLAPSPVSPHASLPVGPGGSWSSPTLPHPATSSPPGPATPGPSGPGCLRVSLIVSIVSIIIIAGVIGTFLIILSPALSLSGSTDVTSGGMLHLHGSYFVPGSGVTLTLDGSLPLHFADRGTTEEAWYSAAAQSAAVSSLVVAGQLVQPTASNGAITVSVAGTFDVTIAVSESWSLGSHTIRATESIGSRSAELAFKIDAKPAKLVVIPSILDFGKLAAGSTATLPVMINNVGGQALNWTADTAGAAWLSLQTSTGAIDPGGAQQLLNVTADVTHLAVGIYSATLQVNSNGGATQVGIKLEVVKAGSKPQAKLSVLPSNLDFGSLAMGKQAKQVVTVSNVGSSALNWTADTGNTGWLALDVSSGTIQPGGSPQTINVTADTANLPAGSDTATLNIKSNGGNVSVGITLVVTSSSGSTLNLLVSPTSFNTSTNCPANTSTAPTGWTCIATLAADASDSSALMWSASSSGVRGITFKPQSDTLQPGQMEQVTISVPNATCPASATFIFAGGTSPVNVSWTCSAPAPTLTVNPTSINANTDCSYGANNGWSCSVALSSPSSNQSNLTWSVSSSALSASYSQSTGTLSPGQSQKIEIFVSSQTVCPTTGTFTFTGGASPVNVSWSCATPTLTVSPTSLGPNNCQSTQNGWVCTVTLTDDEGGAKWTASSDIGATFSPASDTVYPSGETVTITVGCVSGTFTFQGPGNAATVSCIS